MRLVLGRAIVHDAGEREDSGRSWRSKRSGRYFIEATRKESTLNKDDLSATRVAQRMDGI